ncbi:HNH endonuclease [Motilibacter deserti]|uniref:HNH endonuclease n=1 Tax=Motilibacter deserti TaxID=2714956 RepID=A0ABX0GS82_9ACTN|nr:HNH endonuclease [Motilibacter deserti]NHC13736.1 HNH endonuclease [Motilibacter deserti]
MSPPLLDELAVGQRLVALLSAGRRDSTLRLACALALLDAAAESGRGSPGPALPVSIDALADRVVELYWRQTRPYAGGVLLGQGKAAGARLAVLEEVAALAADARAGGSETAHQAAVRLPARYAAARRRIALTLAQQPLTDLQTPAGLRRGSVPPFLYDDSWLGRKATQADLDAHDRAVVLLPGVASALVRLGPLVRPLVERSWAEHVARVNRVEALGAVEGFLFGPDVDRLRPLAEPLADLQGGRCFSCGGPLGRARVEHFVPWSRFPLDAVANLVAVDERCAADRDGALPALSLVFRWHRRRGLYDRGELAGWPVEHARTQAVVLATYASVAAGLPLWAGRGAYEPAAGSEGARVRSLLAA